MKENENEKKDKLSSNYQDYKYVYTGYKDYLNNHKLNKEDIENDIKKEKETINHNHNYVFDFNNPNEHQHDYSFDFNNPNEHQHDYSFDFSQQPKPPNPPQPISQNRDYSFKTNPTYNNSTNLNNKNVDTFLADILKVIAFLFIISIFVIIITFIASMNDEQISNKSEDNYQQSISQITNNYCNAIQQNDYTPIAKYIPTTNSTYINRWEKIITRDYMSGNKISCGKLSITEITSNDTLRIINNNYEYLFNYNAKISKVYRVKVEKIVDDSYDEPIELLISKINDNWYILDFLY